MFTQHEVWHSQGEEGSYKRNSVHKEGIGLHKAGKWLIGREGVITGKEIQLYKE